MTTMKKVLCLLVAFCWMPMMLIAQHLDSATVYRENFDGATMQVTSTHAHFTDGDWILDSTLFVSSPASIRGRLHQSTNLNMTTNTIELASSEIDDSIRYIYLSFDQICKINDLDNAQIYYHTATGLNDDGTPNWGSWRPLSFNTNSDFYYGDGTVDPYITPRPTGPNGHFGTYTAGKFNDKAYGDGANGLWKPNSITQQPTNSWWRHEILEISRFIIAPGVTHFQLQFRINKSSPESSGTENCNGWHIDNLTFLFSNCELEIPRIYFLPLIYAGGDANCGALNTNLRNNTGPYLIQADLKDNDTIDQSKILFTYQINNSPIDTIPTPSANPGTFNNSGHTIHAASWTLPSICYYDTIRYHIFVEDVHGNNYRLDTFLIAWHNQTNIQNNDCRADSINVSEMPHCFITGEAQPVKFYFTNKSDAPHSTSSPYQTDLSVTLKVENENHQVTHNSTHNWSGSICMDISDTLSLGSFIPTKGYNYITAYITTRNGQVDGYHGNDTIRYVGFACDSILNGDYTVGGSNPDFANMQEVLTALEFCGINGPTTFHFRPGTYQDFVFTQNFVGQSEVNTITFQGDSRDQVIVNNNQTDNGTNLFGAVTLINVKNYIFKDLTLQGNNSNTSKGVLFRGNGSTNILFDNCKIIANTTNTTSENCFAVGRTVGATSAQIADDNISFNNCILSGGNFGVYYIGVNNKRNIISFTNNNISSCYRGIYTKYCNVDIQGNHITQYNMGSHQNFSGIYVENTTGPNIDGNTIDNTYDAEYGIYLGSASGADFFIRNNHVKVGNSLYGVYVTGSASSATTTGYVYNNEVILYPVTANNSYAMYSVSSANINILNNSLYIKSDAPYENTAALMLKNNAVLYYNILINECNIGMGNATNYPLYLDGSSTTFSGTYNNLFSPSGVIVSKNGIALNSINEMENNITTTSSNTSILPPIADATASLLPTDFNGLECPKHNSISTDIRGVQRTEITYMGAYANAIPAVDVSVTAMTTPAIGSCPEDSYDLTVTLTNKGSQILNFSNNAATISVHSDSLNLTQTTNVNTGTIALLGSTNQVVASNVVIPTNQNIDLTFIINTTGDANHSNDTLRLNFIMEVAKPDYEEDFSNGTHQTWNIEQLSTGSKIGNWTFMEGADATPSIAPVYGTGMLHFNSKTFASGTKSRAIMPVIDMNGSINPILEVWFAHDKTTSNKTLEGVTVKVSTDNLATFTDLIPEEQTVALLKRYQADATTPEWRLYTYDLSAYSNAGCIYIAFDAESQAGANINIDRIRLRNLVDNDIAVTQLYSQSETPNNFAMSNVVSARLRNDGRDTQNDIKVYLNVTGAAEQYHDSLTVTSLAFGEETVVTFPDHHYNVQEVKNVEVRSRDDQVNSNNAMSWQMITNPNTVNYADTIPADMKIGDYSNIIRPCVRYTMDEELTITAVKYYYDMNYIANPESGFRAFVSNSNGEIVATSDIVEFANLQQGDWNIIPINNFALTNMNNEFYVGIEMLAKGDYLCAQIETPLRDSAFYYLENNGTYTPQTTGRFMIGALVDSPYVHDIAILSLDNPTTRCDLGHEHITLTITNNGSQDLMPGTMFHYSVNGLPAVSEAMTDTLHSHETTTFIFNTVFDFTNNLIDIDSDYAINVWVTKDALDRLQYNDSLALVITSRGKASMPIAPDTIPIPYYTSGVLTAHLPSNISQGVIGWFASTGYESWESLGFSDSTFRTPVIFYDTVFYANANPGYIHDTIVGDTTGNISNGAQPFNFSKGYSRGRILYTENEIGQHGPISAIGVYVNVAANGEDGIPIKLYMKTTTISSFPSSENIDWDNEILDATLVYDGRVYFNQTGWYYLNINMPFNYDSGNLIILTETNCADYCTGTGNQCTTCGNYVSGGTTFPTFRQTNITNGFVQYKDGNTLPLTGTYSNHSKRLTTAFRFADLECGSAKIPIHVHVPNIPTYDVQTISMDWPITKCALYDEQVEVTLQNMLNIAIPAGKVVVHAVFNGNEVTHTINEEFAPEEIKHVTFDNTFDFSAPTANKLFDYVIYTTLNNESVVYSGNDTITGSFTSNYTAGLDTAYHYLANYTEKIEILQLNDRNRLQNNVQTYYFFDSDSNRVFTSTNALPYYLTPNLYDSVVYYVEAKTKTSGCTTRRVPIYINVPVPQYDIMTDALVMPKMYQCGVSESYPIQVQVTNTDTTSTSVVPAGTFSLTAQFTGTQNATGQTIVNAPVSSLDNIVVTFGNGVNIGSKTQNNIYDYTIFSQSTNPNAYVYTPNDTIRGRLYVPAYPTDVPATRTFTNANYGQPYTVNTSNFTNSPYNYYYFYQNSTDETPFAQGLGFVTDPLYDTTIYYYSGRIISPGFDSLITVGTGTSSTNAPFTFTTGTSYGRIQYLSTDLGGVAGHIDTLFIKIKNANTNDGTSVPVKMWMVNVDDTLYTGTAPHIDWDAEIANAKLVFDGDLAFDQTDWYAIPLKGGFDYDGRAIYLYTKHDCNGGSCIVNNGIASNITFSSTSISRRVLTKGTGNEQWASSRWNTRFKFNYTCESPKGILQINTVQRTHDLQLEAILAPSTPNNAYANNEQVQVRITNHGKNTESNFPVKYQLDNQTPVSQNFSGSLASGASATITFTQRLDLTDVYFATPFKVYTDLSSDQYRANDTVHTILEKPTPTSEPTANSNKLHITNVTFSTINNGTAAPYLGHARVGDETYSNFTLDNNLRGEVVQGQMYPLWVYHAFTDNSPKQAYTAVYIDYNRNGEFETNERITPNNGQVTPSSDSLIFRYITIPDTAETGLTRMRIICSKSVIGSPTGYYNAEGETEDYAINILPPYNNDMGLCTYVHPIGDICPDTAATIRIWAKNYGAQTQNFGTSPMTVTSTVTNGAYSNNYNAIVNEGSVLPGDSILVLIKPVNLSAIGSYTILSRLTYAPDQYAHNDTLTTRASTDSLRNVLSLPFFENFDSIASSSFSDLFFPDEWITDQNNLSYSWVVQHGASPNNPDAGPSTDHTQNIVFLYATLPGPANSTNNWATLTTRCINMHYNYEYPVELSYFKHFHGKSTANFTMTIEVGSGTNFQTIKTLHKSDGGQNSATSPWTGDTLALNGIDEVAQLRFKVTQSTGKVDPSLDDIGIIVGAPSIALDSILYPDTVSCLTIGDIIHPIVRIRNTGLSPIYTYDLTYTMSVGPDIVTLHDTIHHALHAGEYFDYETQQGFDLQFPAEHLDFTCLIHIDNERIADTIISIRDNKRHVQTCTNYAIDDLDKDNVILMQNEPNPASNATRISYTLPQAGKTVLSIYSTTGQLLYTDTQEALDGDNYYDVNTSSLADGLYFYSLKYKDVVITKKMVIQR